MEKLSMTLRLDEIDHDKIKVIAKINDRSINRQILRMIHESIENYEREHGEIIIDKGE